MHYNLIFSRILEQTPDNPEAAIKQFMQSDLELPQDLVVKITFFRVNRLGTKDTNNKRPRAIVIKFEH